MRSARDYTRGDQRKTAAGTVASNADAPVQKICTPMHSKMKADSRISTLVPVSPSMRSIRSA